MILLGSIALICIFIVGTIWRGYVISVLWWWFVVPTFDAPELSIPVAIGVALIFRFVGYQPDEIDERKNFSEKCTQLALRVFLLPLIALGVGWIVAWFV